MIGLKFVFIDKLIFCLDILLLFFVDFDWFELWLKGINFVLIICWFWVDFFEDLGVGIVDFLRFLGGYCFNNFLRWWFVKFLILLLEILVRLW